MRRNEARDSRRSDEIEAIGVLDHGQLGEHVHVGIDDFRILQFKGIVDVADDLLDRLGEDCGHAEAEEKLFHRVVVVVVWGQSLFADVVEEAGQDDGIGVVLQFRMVVFFLGLDAQGELEHALDMLVVVRGIF